ncbi:MAG: sulfatase-like hydrolase/transferase [Bacteroidia bacterium]
MPLRWCMNVVGCLMFLMAHFAYSAFSQCLPGTRPNFIVFISDDQSWAHTSIAGDPVVQTPNFDRLAKEGVLFTQAYCSASSCTPSRSALLTGRNIYELENAAILNSFLPSHFTTYQDILEDAGYLVGCIGKGTKPGLQSRGGRTRDPAGWEYNGATILGAPAGVNPVDFAANLEEGLNARQEGQPFSFWIGSYEPHRPYGGGVGRFSGMDTSRLAIPPFLPNVSDFSRDEFADYLFEIQWFDRQLGEIMKTLEKAGELDNTIILVTADNGMPFPRAKLELYEYGVHVPLAIRWPKAVPAGRMIGDYVTLKDIAPTFLEAAGLEIPSSMTAKSFLNVLTSTKDGRVDPSRDHCFVAHERHGNDGKRPRRGFYSDDYIYIYNYPCCLKRVFSDDSLWAETLFEANRNIMPYSSLLWKFRTHPMVRQYWEWYRGERKEHELFDRKNDPFQLHNLAYDPDYVTTRDSLYQMIMDYGSQTGDPRATDPETDIFDTYQEFAGTWLSQNPQAPAEDRAVMVESGTGRKKGSPVPLPSGGVKEVWLESVSTPAPFLLSGTLGWAGARPGREITRYRIYFFDQYREQLPGVVADVCSDTRKLALKDIQVTSDASFIGVVSANDAGEFYLPESMVPLPQFYPDVVYPQPVTAEFVLRFFWEPQADFSWEILDIHGRSVTPVYNDYICSGDACSLSGNLRGYAAGLYFLKIISGGRQLTYRLMKTDY